MIRLVLRRQAERALADEGPFGSVRRLVRLAVAKREKGGLENLPQSCAMGLLVKLCWSADAGRAPFGLARLEGRL
jgi:hypothetical protein